METIISKNGPYFAHINRKCICGICVCGKCLCKAPKTLEIPFSVLKQCSEYQSNFQSNSLRSQSIDFKPREPLFQHGLLNQKTIYNCDFNNPNIENFKICQNAIFSPRHLVDPELDQAKAPFTKNSLYQENYLNFGTVMAGFMFKPSKVSTIDHRLPFYSQAVNKEYGNFKKEDICPLINGKAFGKSQFKNPISTEVVFKEISNMKECFVPYPNYERVHLRMPKQELESDKLPPFVNKFKSSTNEFSGVQNKICPARIVLNKIRS